MRLYSVTLGIGILMLLSAAIVTSHFIPNEKKPVIPNEKKPANIATSQQLLFDPLKDKKSPIVIAHRGGAGLAPENTLVAFEKARAIGADVIELDIQMSKDGHLVVIHDTTVDRTTNGHGKVSEKTKKELRKLDAGYHFKNDKGEYIFRDKGIKIPLLEEVFQHFQDMHLIVEIKKTETKSRWHKAEKKLWKLIKKYDMQDNVLVFSFDQEILEKFEKYAKGRVAIGASRDEATRFVVLHKLNLANFYKTSSDAFIVPPKKNKVRLTTKRLINVMHNLNKKIYYWTINSEKQMRFLLRRGADGIITDRPDLLIKVMQESKVLHESKQKKSLNS